MMVAALDALTTAVFALVALESMRRRDRPGGALLGALMGLLAGVGAVLALHRIGMVPFDVGLVGVAGGWMAAVPVWVGFVAAYTGRGPEITRRRAALALGYIAVLATASLGAVDLTGVWRQTARVVVSILQTGHIGAGLFAVFLVGRSALRYGDLSRSRATTLVLGGLGVSVLILAVGVVGTSRSTMPLGVSVVLGGTAAAFAGGVFGTSLLDETPGTGPLARQSAIAEMTESVVVTDTAGRLVDANQVTETAFDVDLTRDTGRNIDAVLGFDPSAAAGEPITVSTPAGNRRVDVQQSTVSDRSGDIVGTSYLIRDVTDRQTREEQLAVMTRVLRHNIRNDLDAIRGFAEALEAGDETATRAASRIQETASDLADVGTTVQRANRVVTRDPESPDAVDITALLTEVADAVTKEYAGNIEIDGGNLTVHTDRPLLRAALYEVIENAIEHGSDPQPTATVTVTRLDDGVQITVADDGPGIPEQERAVIRAGEEEPLRHGTGVGLWVASWALTRLGGTLTFEAESSGTVVRIEVPDRRLASTTSWRPSIGVF